MVQPTTLSVLYSIVELYKVATLLILISTRHQVHCHLEIHDHTKDQVEYQSEARYVLSLVSTSQEAAASARTQ